MRLTLALAALLLASSMHAQSLCGAEPSSLAAHFSGTWESLVVASRVHVGTVKQDGPSGETEMVTFDFGADGTGQMTVKGEALDAVIHETGGLAMLEKPDHLSAFAAAAKKASTAERAPLKDCDVRSAPQISATRSVALEGQRAENTMELMALGPDTLAGAQVVILPMNGVETKIVSALLLRRKKEASE